MTEPSAGRGEAELRAEALRFQYGDDGFNLHLPELILGAGEVLVLTGPSGSGKTTLLRLLCGLLTADSGKIFLDGLALNSQPPAAVRDQRLRHLGLVFQDFALLDYLTARENALLPARFLGMRGTALAAIDTHARELAERLDLTPHWDRRTADLSQGERQRVAVVRALALKPRYVFADEPTAALDRDRRDRVAGLLEEYACREKAPLVLVTHDPDLARRFPRCLPLEDLRP